MSSLVKVGFADRHLQHAVDHPKPRPPEAPPSGWGERC
jgi:hypothetical protein